jgi:hypothetical protein
VAQFMSNCEISAGSRHRLIYDNAEAIAVRLPERLEATLAWQTWTFNDLCHVPLCSHVC